MLQYHQLKSLNKSNNHLKLIQIEDKKTNEAKTDPNQKSQKRKGNN